MLGPLTKSTKCFILSRFDLIKYLTRVLAWSNIDPKILAKIKTKDKRNIFFISRENYMGGGISSVFFFQVSVTFALSISIIFSAETGSVGMSSICSFFYLSSPFSFGKISSIQAKSSIRNRFTSSFLTESWSSMNISPPGPLSLEVRLLT